MMRVYIGQDSPLWSQRNSIYEMDICNLNSKGTVSANAFHHRKEILDKRYRERELPSKSKEFLY